MVKKKSSKAKRVTIADMKTTRRTSPKGGTGVVRTYKVSDVTLKRG